MGYVSFNDEGKDIKVQYFIGLGRKVRHIRTAHVPKGDITLLAAEVATTLQVLRDNRSPVGKVDR